MKSKLKLSAIAVALVAGGLLARCGDDKKTPTQEPEQRPNSCKADLTPFLVTSGNGVSAAKIDSADQLIGGEAANGRVGDYLLQNGKIRVVIQAPDRHIGPDPYGGQIIDADLVHDGPGKDAFGKIALLFNFGRTQDATAVTVLEDGHAGGPAVIAADGVDAVNDFINVNSMVTGLLGAPLTVDANKELGLKITNYYILNPGESRVRVVSALCNTGSAALAMPVGDLIDSGGNLEFFHSQACTGGFGYVGSGCSVPVDNMSWYGFQGDGIAYGYAPYEPNTPGKPSLRNGSLVTSGVVGTLLATGSDEAVNTLISYTDPSAKKHASDMLIPAGEGKVLVRDFVVGKDLGEVATEITTYRNDILQLPLGQISGTVTEGATPIAGARVALERDIVDPNMNTKHIVETVFTTGADGKFSGRLTAADYTISAWSPGHAPAKAVPVSIPSGGTATQDFSLAAPRKLTVNVKDVDGNVMPAKLTLMCDGPCAAPSSSLKRFTDVVRDPIPDNTQFQGYIGPTGTLTIQVPAGKYRALVTRGFEWSVWPQTWAPKNSDDVATAELVDLSTADGTINASLARIIDSTGWMSADFHVHAINSPDSPIPNEDRLVSFMGEGVDVLVNTDHDFVTDLAALNEQIGGKKFLKTVVGTEITTFDYGHTNAFPLVRDPNDIFGGNIDWAGGPGASLPPQAIFDAARARGAKTVHVNHPRGALGVFSAVHLDTDSFKTHADPALYRIAPQPDATADDTRLFGTNFNALEVFNSGSDNYVADARRGNMNDWFTFLSRGVLVTATGVSDTHEKLATGAGYYRTFVNVGTDDPAALDSDALSDHTNKMQAFTSIGPFVKFTAHKLDGSGMPTGGDVGIGGTLATGGANVELVVDLQVAPWIPVGHIDIMSHIPGGDGACPAAADTAKYPKSRVACDGKTNSRWPVEGIVASATIGTADVVSEKAVTKNGVDYLRNRITKKFTLATPPSKDTWFVAIVYGPDNATSWPLLHKFDTSKKRAGEVPTFAATNPIFIDADGGGYDKFPAKQYGLAKPLAGPTAPLKPLEKLKGRPTEEQLRHFFEEATEHE